MTISAYDRELEYVRACLTVDLFPDQSIPDPEPGMDWDQLLKILQNYRLAAHFYFIGKRVTTDWPASFCEELRKEHYRYLIYGDQCTLQVRAALTALRAAGIEVIVLKGWAFIQTLYGGDASKRFCADIDILVQQEDIKAAEEILQENGYEGTDEFWPGYRQRYKNARAFFPVKQVGPFGYPFSVGLHWGLLQIPAYSINLINGHSLFERAQPLNVAGVNVSKLALEDEIVYACAHYWLHHRTYDVLLHYFETAALILKASRTLDWDMLLQHAQTWQVVLSVQNVLTGIERLWPNVVPPQVLEQLMQVKPIAREYFIDRWIKFAKNNGNLLLLLKWLTLPSPWYRLRFIYEMFFPGSDYMLKHYGGMGAWLYFKRLVLAIQYYLKQLVAR